MPLREIPAIYWTLPQVTRAKPSRAGHPHLFARDVEGSACDPAIKPRIRGARLRRNPPPNACRSCLRCWRTGWGQPAQPGSEP